MNSSNNTIMIRVHEIALKGKNRDMFFDKLVDNLKKALMGMDLSSINKRHLGIEMVFKPTTDWTQVEQRIKQVFGVVKFYRCYKIGKSIADIKDFLSAELVSHKFESFRITGKRGDKSYPVSSLDINKQIGAFVHETTGAKVDLKQPELNIYLEILTDATLVYFEEIAGPGGIPVGISGKVAVLLSGGIDSPVAAWRMMKRGCEVVLIHFHSFPLVDGSSREKVIELTEVLNAYQYKSTLHLVPFGEVQKEIIVSVPPALRIVVYRRFMARIAEQIAEQSGSQMLVTGESLGQVASQTLENLATIRNAIKSPVLSPLIGMDKQEIINQARHIGTYDTSILPDEDCCSLFTPKHPATHSTVNEIDKVETNLQVDRLVQMAIENTEVRTFSSV